MGDNLCYDIEIVHVGRQRDGEAGSEVVRLHLVQQRIPKRGVDTDGVAGKTAHGNRNARPPWRPEKSAHLSGNRSAVFAGAGGETKIWGSFSLEKPHKCTIVLDNIDLITLGWIKWKVKIHQS